MLLFGYATFFVRFSLYDPPTVLRIISMTTTPNNTMTDSNSAKLIMMITDKSGISYSLNLFFTTIPRITRDVNIFFNIAGIYINNFILRWNLLLFPPLMGYAYAYST